MSVTVGGGHAVFARAGPTARGTLMISETEHGFEIRLDGRGVAFVDLLYPAEGSGDPQVIIDGGPGDEPLAKLVVPLAAAEPVRLVVHGRADGRPAPDKQGIHSDSSDWVFVGEAPEVESAET